MTDPIKAKIQELLPDMDWKKAERTAERARIREAIEGMKKRINTPDFGTTRREGYNAALTDLLDALKDPK